MRRCDCQWGMLQTFETSVRRFHIISPQKKCFLSRRLWRKKGICIVKRQHEAESGKQCFPHVEVIHLLKLFGFEVIDLLRDGATFHPHHEEGPAEVPKEESQLSARGEVPPFSTFSIRTQELIQGEVGRFLIGRHSTIYKPSLQSDRKS